MGKSASNNLSHVRVGLAPGLIEETAAIVWRALQQSPLSALRITIGGSDANGPDASALLRISSDVGAFCRAAEAEVAVYAKRIEQRSPEVVSELRKLVRVSAQHDGAADEDRCDIFAGRYSATPGGVHREPWDNNHLVLDGEKTFRFWHDDAVRMSIHSDEIKPYSTRLGIEQYIALDDWNPMPPATMTHVVGAGAFARWPAGVWHVAECAALPCLSVNLAQHREIQSDSVN